MAGLACPPCRVATLFYFLPWAFDHVRGRRSARQHHDRSSISTRRPSPGEPAPPRVTAGVRQQGRPAPRQTRFPIGGRGRDEHAVCGQPVDHVVVGKTMYSVPIEVAQFETARFRPAYSGANSCWFSLPWGGVRCFPVPRATRVPRAGLAFTLGSPRSGSWGLAEGIRTRHGAAPLRFPWPVTWRTSCD